MKKAAVGGEGFVIRNQSGQRGRYVFVPKHYDCLVSVISMFSLFFSVDVGKFHFV